MRLVYTANQQPVITGDRVTINGVAVTVDFFTQPHKPDSSGKVQVRYDDGSATEYYVSIIGAEWIEREDRATEVAR